MLIMPHMASRKDIMPYVITGIKQAVCFFDYIYLLINIINSSRPVKMVIQPRLDNQPARSNHRRNISHIYVFPEVWNIVAAAVVVKIKVCIPESIHISAYDYLLHTFIKCSKPHSLHSAP